MLKSAALTVFMRVNPFQAFVVVVFFFQTTPSDFHNFSPFTLIQSGLLQNKCSDQTNESLYENHIKYKKVSPSC